MTNARLQAPARHLAPIVKSYSLSGDVAAAQQLLDEAQRDGVKLDAPCFNGLLEGMVRFMVGGGGATAAAAAAGAAGDLKNQNVFGMDLDEQ